MKDLKSFIAVLVAFVAVFALAACGGSKVKVTLEFNTEHGEVLIVAEDGFLESGVKVDKGTEIAIVVNAESGYIINTFTINGTDKKSLLDGTDSNAGAIIKVQEDVVISVGFEEETSDTDDGGIEIISGGDGAWNRDGNDGYEIRLDMDIEEFEGLKINGEWVDPSNYTVTSGSTIVTLKLAYLKSLGVAEHTLTIVFDSGTVETTLSVTEEECEECGKFPCECEGTSAWIFEDLDSVIRAITTANARSTIIQPSGNVENHWYTPTAIYSHYDSFLGTDERYLRIKEGDKYYIYYWNEADLVIAYEIEESEFTDFVDSNLVDGAFLFTSALYDFDEEHGFYEMKADALAYLGYIGLEGVESATLTLEDGAIVFTAYIPYGDTEYTFIVKVFDFGTAVVDVAPPDIAISLEVFGDAVDMTLDTRYDVTSATDTFKFTATESRFYRFAPDTSVDYDNYYLRDGELPDDDGDSRQLSYYMFMIVDEDGYQVAGREFFGNGGWTHRGQFEVELEAGKTYYVRIIDFYQSFDRETHEPLPAYPLVVQEYTPIIDEGGDEVVGRD